VAVIAKTIFPRSLQTYAKCSSVITHLLTEHWKAGDRDLWSVISRWYQNYIFFWLRR